MSATGKSTGLSLLYWVGLKVELSWCCKQMETAGLENCIGAVVGKEVSDSSDSPV